MMLPHAFSLLYLPHVAHDLTYLYGCNMRAYSLHLLKVERHLADGFKEIRFADGTSKVTSP